MNKYVFSRVNEPEKLNTPPIKSSIEQVDWSNFVISRLSEEFKTKSQEQKKRRSQMQYPYKLSRKGYARLAEECATELGNNDEINIAILWMKARLPKEEDIKEESLKETITKIDEYIQQKKEGNFIMEGKRDGILAKALHSQEHWGCLRGTGGHVTPSTYSVVSSRMLVDKDLQLQEQRKINLELDARVKKLEALILKNAPTHEVDKEEKGSCSVKLPSPLMMEDERVKDDKPQIQKNHHQNEDSDDDLKIVPNNWPAKGEPVALTLTSQADIAAYGTIIKVGGANQFLHGNLLPENCMSVSIDQALDHDAPLPIPGECNSIGETVGSHVAWPSHLIKPKVKKPGKKKIVHKDLPTVDLSSVPKPLHMLYCYTKLVIQNGGNVQIEVDHEVFGREFNIFVNIEDIVPFCQLEPISYVCVVVYMWHLYKRLVNENKLQNFRFVDPYEIGHLPSTKGDQDFRENEMERRACALAKRLSGTLPSQLVLAPCNVGFHWILTVINPHKQTCHLLDHLYHRLHDQT